MLAPKATSRGEAFRKSARTCRAFGEGLVGLVAGGEGPVRVGVVVEEVVGHRLDDPAGHLGAAGAVEVGHGLPVRAGAQRREVGPDLGS